MIPKGDGINRIVLSCALLAVGLTGSVWAGFNGLNMSVQDLGWRHGGGFKKQGKTLEGDFRQSADLYCLPCTTENPRFA